MFWGVAVHLQVDSAGSVISLEVYPTVEFSVPVGGNFLLGFDDVNELLRFFMPGVLYVKFIVNKDEYYRAGFMFEEAGCMFQLAIALLGGVR